MKKTIAAIILLLLFAANSFAQYNIHLKNGSVIRGVASYHEVNGELRFSYMGGTMGIPLESVARVEEARTGDVVIAPEPGDSGITERSKPVVPSWQLPAQPGPQSGSMQPTPQAGILKQRLSQIDGRLAQIEAKEAQYNEVKKEYDHVRLRIEVLFQKGVAEAKKKGGDPAKWFQFLPPQEREWAQLNTLKKNQMKKDLERMEMELAPLRQEKTALIEEKQDIEQKLKELESPF